MKLKVKLSITSPDSSAAPLSLDLDIAGDGTFSFASGVLTQPLPAPIKTNISAIWVNDGGDKVAHGELRASNGANLSNSVWSHMNGVKLFGAKNEVVSFNLILEAKDAAASKVSVSFSRLTGPNGAVIESKPTTGDGVFTWTDRPIELFYVRYLPVKGLSFLGYGNYDERAIPKRLRRPFTLAPVPQAGWDKAVGTGGWTERLDHDAFYPDIAVPLELVPSFDIAAGSNQSIWCDVYIPKSAQTGLYTGMLLVTEGASPPQAVPVELTVRKFTLPDVPWAKSMIHYEPADINSRYVNSSNANKKYLPGGDPAVAKVMPVYDRHYLLAHRHKLTLSADTGWIDDDFAGTDQPGKSTLHRLKGSFYRAANGYDGPGVGQPNDFYSIGTYFGWSAWATDQASVWKHADAWENWFAANAPEIQHALYGPDESKDFPLLEKLAGWVKSNPGPGGKIPFLSTMMMMDALKTPSVGIVVQPGGFAIKDATIAAKIALEMTGKIIFAYNGERPGSGSVDLEDDGVALRMRPWAQWKFHIARWFEWQSTGYSGEASAGKSVNVFQSAATFGVVNRTDPILGEFGPSYSNGLLFYPGTDQLYPADSYGLNGPIASLRLKHWRRGVQDADYLELANSIDPAKTAAIVTRMVPKVLWEVGVTDPTDPSYVLADISWPTDPDAWEAARVELAAIIEGEDLF